MIFILLALLASPAAAQRSAPLPACATTEPGYYVAKIENPAENFGVMTESRVFGSVCGAGVLVTNGTFFMPGAALGDVIVDGEIRRQPKGGGRRFKKDGRHIDLGKRWGVGVIKNSRVLGVADGDTALRTMGTFLGGGGVLLSDGEDVSFLNESRAGQWGASFSRDILDDERGRTALGLKLEEGRQVLLLVSTKNSAKATVPALAKLMKGLGATEAVFYDGGGALGFAAGGECLEFPSNKGEDLNPTHIVIKACR
ncbi:MAG: phosphodiester glycosidase family protein [Elusimicrobia bacterium]|nr:phosphodiester glycosidase family protein [Elusimicrobiota bacterium]